MKKILIWTDGACKGNPGPGGWGAVMKFGTHHKELSGGRANTTNNTMELAAVYAALASVKNNKFDIVIHTDSANVIGWLSLGWKTRKSHIADAVMKIRNLISERGLRVSYKKVPAHSGIPENERADTLASNAALAQERRVK